MAVLAFFYGVLLPIIALLLYQYVSEASAYYAVILAVGVGAIFLVFEWVTRWLKNRRRSS